jgi:serine/threonine protein kinase
MTHYACPACGAPLRPQSRFCPHCGRPTATPTELTGALRGGDYEIVRSISKGGMGAIYLARDTRAFGRLCVIKQMLTYYDASDEQQRRQARQRFEEEGRTLAYLNHPGIPKIYTFFEESGGYYLVMEYIEGRNLESFVTRRLGGRSTAPGAMIHREEVIRYAVQLCRILEYLHGQQRPVMHLDIKPANLILEAQLGDVRLVDFGTAGVRQGGNVGNDGADAAVYGTDGYAPPEQYRGRPVPRSDVFAAAATIYHLLTDDDPRDHPFKWPKLAALPQELALALERALRPDPERRSTASELRVALETLSTPSRTLEAFTFPGNVQIRTVGALPTLCDQHWDVARRFLYQGDFQRWLGDLNRLDLAVAADEIRKGEQNQDRGLERFLHIVDPGLPHPQVEASQPSINLGSIAREAALIEHLKIDNRSRGYAQVSVSADEPWIEAFPTTLHLWAGRPVELTVTVHAEDLPLRRQQQGTVTLVCETEGATDSTAAAGPVQVSILARVSVWREVLRILWRAFSTAVPTAWRGIVAAGRWGASMSQKLVRPFRRSPWLFWLLWAALSVGAGVGLHYGRDLLLANSTLDKLVGPVIGFMPPLGMALAAVLGPPALLIALWLIVIVAVVLASGVLGAIKGVWRSFAR